MIRDAGFCNAHDYNNFTKLKWNQAKLLVCLDLCILKIEGVEYSTAMENFLSMVFGMILLLVGRLFLKSPKLPHSIYWLNFPSLILKALFYIIRIILSLPRFDTEVKVLFLLLFDLIL